MARIGLVLYVPSQLNEVYSYGLLLLFFCSFAIAVAVAISAAAAAAAAAVTAPHTIAEAINANLKAFQHLVFFFFLVWFGCRCFHLQHMFISIHLFWLPLLSIHLALCTIILPKNLSVLCPHSI